jgi:outer membrane protein OmpA-like peptidoglycan-associated protein
VSALSPLDRAGLSSGPAAGEALPGTHAVTCTLEPLPKVSNLDGRVTDSATGEAIGSATVRITDVLGRGLELQVDEVGAFRFLNIPPGTANITVQADGYLRSVTRMEVEPLQELEARFVLTPTPAKSAIRIAGKQLELARPIVFGNGSADLSRETLSMVQELAPFLSEHPDLGRIEVQAHTSDDGPLADSLTADRANALRDALLLHGVPAGMLSARGYGGTEPLDKGDSERARLRNERIVFKILSP